MQRSRGENRWEIGDFQRVTWLLAALMPAVDRDDVRGLVDVVHDEPFAVGKKCQPPNRAGQVPVGEEFHAIEIPKLDAIAIVDQNARARTVDCEARHPLRSSPGIRFAVSTGRLGLVLVARSTSNSNSFGNGGTPTVVANSLAATASVLPSCENANSLILPGQYNEAMLSPVARSHNATVAVEDSLTGVLGIMLRSPSRTAAVRPSRLMTTSSTHSFCPSVLGRGANFLTLARLNVPNTEIFSIRRHESSAVQAEGDRVADRRVFVERFQQGSVRRSHEVNDVDWSAAGRDTE